MKSPDSVRSLSYYMILAGIIAENFRSSYEKSEKEAKRSSLVSIDDSAKSALSIPTHLMGKE